MAPLFSLLLRDVLRHAALAKVRVRLVVLVVLAASILVGSGTTALAAVARVQSQTASGGTSATATWSSATTAGNFLAAAVTFNCGSNASITAPSGWTAGTRSNNGTTIGVALYYYTSAPSQTSSGWSISGTGCTAMTVSVHEYAGIATSSVVDQTASSAGASTNPFTGNTATTTQAEGLVFVGLASLSNPGFSLWSDSLTEVTDVASGTTINGATGDRVISSTGVYTGSAYVGATSRSWAGALTVFKAQVSGTAKYWTGSTAGTFTDNRWSTTEGGSVNTTAPSTGDRAVFSGSTGNCSIASDVSVTAIDMASTYTGTVSLTSAGSITTSDYFSRQAAPSMEAALSPLR